MVVIAAGCKITIKEFSLDTHLPFCIAGVLITESTGTLEQMDICSQQKPGSDESDGQHEGEM